MSRRSPAPPRARRTVARAPLRLQVLGYWFHELAPDDLPRPQDLVGRWPAAERALVVRYLRAGRELLRYDAAAPCRFACGVRHVGSGERTDGTFVWPEGLAHYVERHRVRLPERFLAHVRRRGGELPSFSMPTLGDVRYDLKSWRRWARAQGACLNLRGWQVPDPAAERRIVGELSPRLAAAVQRVMLCRRATRQVVLLRHDGRHELRQLRPDGHRPRRFLSFANWPRL